MAAESVSAHVSAGQMLALKAFYDRPDEALDDFQLAELTGWRQTSIGKRRGELERKGYVLKADRRFEPVELDQFSCAVLPDHGRRNGLLRPGDEQVTGHRPRLPQSHETQATTTKAVNRLLRRVRRAPGGRHACLCGLC
jgi:hypothetical protein